MKRRLAKISFFVTSFIVGGLVFGLVQSPILHAITRGGGTPPQYCNANGDPATMCYNGTTIYNVAAAQQDTYLKSGTATCGACATSPP